MKNSTKKYNNNIGQNTGTSNISKNVINIDVTIALEHEYQNLNSGSLLANGLDLSFKYICKVLKF